MSAAAQRDWLVDQLPRVMREDPVIAAFARTGQQLGDTIRAQIDSVEHQLDPTLASPTMLSYLAGWLGFALDHSDEAAFHRPLLPVLGRVAQLRGTRDGLALLARALTRGPVEVFDPGGIYTPSESVPQVDPLVVVRVADPGPLGPQRLLSLLEREVPVGVRVRLEVGG
jgi:phage tail-like protein